LHLDDQRTRLDRVRRPRRHQDRVARLKLDRVECVEHRVGILVAHPSRERRSAHVVAEAQAHRGGRALRADDDPSLRLPVRRAQLLAREGVVRMHVHRQPLSGVEQLDEQPRLAAAASGVVGPKEADRVRRHRVPEQLTVRQAAQPELLLAEDRRGRADPLLGFPLRRMVHPAQRGDRGPAAVEAGDAVRRQNHGPQGATSPEPRITSSRSIVLR
jgi:hypothetical protein